MKLRLPKLHNQILIALIAGALFGAFFNVAKSSLKISYSDNNEITTVKIKDWQSFIFILNNEKIDSVQFDATDQLAIISFFDKHKVNIKEILVSDFQIDGQNIHNKSFTNIVSIHRQGTIATGIKWIGDIFIRLLMMIAVPLVFVSLTVGAASLGDVKRFARIGGKTLTYYITTTAFAITIGLVLANVIQPGHRMSANTKDRLLSVYEEDASSKLGDIHEYDFFGEIVKMVPKNPIGSMANGDMLQVVIFSILLGLMLSLIDKEKSAFVIKLLDALTDALIKLVDMIMLIAPLGVFALIAATVSEFGFDILETLIWYALAVLLGLAIHTFGTYGLILKIFTKVKVSYFYKSIKRVQAIGFSTSSSAATLPVNIETCEENLGVSKSIASFVLPLGATINMDGTALYQGVAAVFIAQVFGIELNIVQQLTIVFMAVLASIGTAPVPGVGIIMLVIILKSVNIPQEGIALILGVDRILDMCRTVTNVTGDATGAVLIATSENEIILPQH